VPHIFRWDLDKTYLRTEFDTFRDLVKSALETAHDKRAVPGAPALLRALRAAGGRDHRICIVSGSPTQMRTVLAAKLQLDGVDWDEFVLKPNLKNLLRGRFRALRQQVPYKLPAMLESRMRHGGATPETLFGDDAESDAVIYCLYADILAGKLTREKLERILDVVHAYPDQRATTIDLATRIPKGDAVRRIVIHLDRRSPTARFDRFGSRLVPVYNYFQAALVLFGDGQLEALGVLAVAREMIASGDYSLSILANSLQDLLRRGRLPRDVAARLALECQAIADGHPDAWADLPPKDEIAWTFATRVRELGDYATVVPPEGEKIDYPSLLLKEGHRYSTRDG
jgi:hypothetical protein